MKNHINLTARIMLCLCLGLALFIGCAQTSGRSGKAATSPTLERYEDKALGFSIEYDAKTLTKDLMPEGTFVFRRESSKGMPSVGIAANPYPPGMALSDTTSEITRSLPQTIPGSRVHRVTNQQSIELKDGTQANYFEIDWNVRNTECIGSFVAAKKDNRLVVFGAADQKGGSMQNLAAMVKSLSFDVEVDETALKAKGYGTNGKFIRTDPPAFTLEYPTGFQNRDLLPYQIFRAGIPRGSPSMSIAIYPIRGGGIVIPQLEAMAERYADSLWSVGRDIKIISQNPIENYGDFDAYEVRIAWRYMAQIPLKTIVHFIAKHDKAISLVGHTAYGTGELFDIFNTINLNP